MKKIASKKYLLAATVVFAMVSKAHGAEITAIDFNGDLIGKVISDGKVVSYENELIGNVTADSLIVNFDGNLIGGVVPQGIAIGTDNRILGKVNSDGSVRQASGRIIGKVLPNGLVIDDYFKVIGGVLFPGLIYSDKGEITGRLTGNGQYTDIEGRKKGFITPDGYAYSQEGGETQLEGRLISNKMVVSPEGKFIGSIVPGGEVRDLDGEKIGRIHANGIAYNENLEIIGQLVRNGYAFDNLGQYIGLLIYNGEVVNKGEVVGYQGMNNEVVDENGKVMGYIADIGATVSSPKGEYIGRVMPEGKIAKTRETIGEVGPNGIIRDNEKKEIGKIIETGPVFDYQGKIRGQSTASGETVSIEGSPLGYAYGNQSYETNGKMLGKTLANNLSVDLNNQPLGVAGITGTIDKGEKRYQVSPLGYVFSADGQLGGQQLSNSAIYSINGLEGARVTLNGELKIDGADSGGKITQSGVALRDNGSVMGAQIWVERALTFLKESIGNIAGNLVVNNQNKIIGKILPDMAVISATNENETQLMPKIGTASRAELALSFRGDHLGYVLDNGEVKDLGGAIIGKANSNGSITDNNGILIGGMMNYKSIIDSKCQPLGYLNSVGDIRNNRGVKIGRILQNNQAVDESGSHIGYGVEMGLVMGESGILGTISADGKVLDPENKMLGCMSARGRLYGQDGKLLGIRIEQYPVMNFNNKIIGRTILDNQVTNDNNQLIGQGYPDENIKSGSGAIIGRLFKYRYAFDNGNRYMGEISANGNVVDNNGKEIGQVTLEGYVKDATGANIGYALYDMYLYDKENKSIGIIGVDGGIRNNEGSRISQLDRGFMVDRTGTVIARGNRDYYILNENHEIIGELEFNGELKNLNGAVLGKLGTEGGIYNDSGEIIAKANPLQYYNVTQDREKIYDSEGNVVGYVAGEGNVYDENGKLIGKLGEDGTVRGADGSIIGGKGQDWYARQPQTEQKKELPQIGVYEKSEMGENIDYSGDKYRKSLNIALTPDGEYLGDILEDGRVVDKAGNYIGRKTPDGLIIDDDGTLIGIEEVKRPDGGEMFVPAGTFGDGGAYGIGTVGSNLGPGGGFGPGERYDPQRAAALAAAQNFRRQNMAVGHISSGIKPESFDGYQKNWDNEGIGKAISSWRVDMSEMIFADKPIPAVISRSIDSNNPTPVTAYVERNVYAEEGRKVIIPAGSRLMGSLNGMTATTEATSSSARVQITWERLIRPDGVLFTFQGITADAMGRGGALGYLDQQLFKKYTLPVMTTMLTSYTSYLLATDNNSSGEVETSRQQAANDARENFLDQMNEVFSEILEDKSNIKPLTYVPAGTRIIVFPNVDLWLRTIERENETSADNVKTGDVLISHEEEMQKVRDNAAGNVQGGSQTVYQPEGSGTGSPKLVESSSGSSNNDINGAVPPPPPPSSSNLTPAVTTGSRAPSGAGTTGGSGSSTANDDSVPQLF